ncbi:hypothetical protein CAPTEDRAFT_216938 [Capitella teleta]|uniref:Uncharacterized protein n=1 Tax=Capitella teleta TaxID=283909 RepID=R7T5A5_CAPTE|nr:hypothetical protein CAPTEDRAFT_216938 [Capitella teleta]|eukprot:ELT88151.1 hypothetical protein CAPTEDRAFT_216938 [Capitella teleta]
MGSKRCRVHSMREDELYGWHSHRIGEEYINELEVGRLILFYKLLLNALTKGLSNPRGGINFDSTGGSSDYLCLPSDPQWGSYNEVTNGLGEVWGAEYKTASFPFTLRNEGPSTLQNQNVPCACCMQSQDPCKRPDGASSPGVPRRMDEGVFGVLYFCCQDSQGQNPVRDLCRMLMSLGIEMKTELCFTQ